MGNTEHAIKENKKIKCEKFELRLKSFTKNVIKAILKFYILNWEDPGMFYYFSNDLLLNGIFLILWFFICCENWCQKQNFYQK